MSKAHTPDKTEYSALPWVWSGLQLLSDQKTYSDTILIAEHGSFEPTDEDKALIIRAVNSHAAMEEALLNCEAMMVAIECGHTKPLGFGTVIDEARAALKLAKE